ncbi:MAG: hypothetical protein ACE5JG_12940, partial [Planctomycetota bacterium]
RATDQLLQARRDAAGDPKLLAVSAFKLGALYEHAREYRRAIDYYEEHIELGGAHSAKARSRIRHIYEHAFEE